MCGIIGCVQRGGDCWPRVYDGLKRLEYRGYDSVGVAVLDQNAIGIRKKKGGADALADAYLKGGAGIGHTRWATHGAPSDENAHPHAAGKFALVHNGIVENFAALKEELVAAGEIFLSETDSEVIVKLISRAYTGDFLRAVRDGCARLEGSYAIAVLCEDFPDTVVCAKCKSPLVAGTGADGVYVCSDIPALSGVCGSICPASDGELICLVGQRVLFYDFNLNAVDKTFTPSDGGSAVRERGAFTSYMEEEIADIPRALSDTYAALKGMDFTACARKLAAAERIFAVACGTAFHSTLSFRFVAEKCLGVPVICERASEFRYKTRLIQKDDVLVAVSQSGETADTAEAVKRAKAAGAYVVSVTNVRHSTIAALSDTNVPMRANAEIAVAATKSYNCQLMCLFTLAAEACCKKTGVYPSFYYDLPALSFAAREAFSCFPEVDALASRLKEKSAMYFLGRDADFVTAVEGALKVKEIAYVFSEGYPAGELKHGTLALVEKGFPVIAIVTQKSLAKKTENAVAEVIARGGYVALFSPFESVLKESAAQFCCKIPAVREELAGAVSVIPLQYFALRMCQLRGHDPDKPRNLAKSVTVE